MQFSCWSLDKVILVLRSQHLSLKTNLPLKRTSVKLKFLKYISQNLLHVWVKPGRKHFIFAPGSFVYMAQSSHIDEQVMVVQKIPYQ